MLNRLLLNLLTKSAVRKAQENDVATKLVLYSVIVTSRFIALGNHALQPDSLSNVYINVYFQLHGARARMLLLAG